MIYADFKTHLATFLWKTNDADLIASLDDLILMANAELDRATANLSKRDVATTISMVSNAYALPADVKQLRTVASSTLGPFSRATRNQFDADTAITGLAGGATKLYYVSGRTLNVAGDITATTPLDLTVTYKGLIPDYAATGASWLADDYLDLYTYAVLKHTAPFLREDARVPLWDKMYSNSLASVLEDDMFNTTYGGSPLYARPARTAP